MPNTSDHDVVGNLLSDELKQKFSTIYACWSPEWLLTNLN